MLPLLEERPDHVPVEHRGVIDEERVLALALAKVQRLHQVGDRRQKVVLAAAK